MAIQPKHERIFEAFKKKVCFKMEEFELFSQYLKVVNLKKNEIWEEEGKQSKQMGFLNKGVMREYFLKDGNEFTSAFYVEGEFLGNYISYMQKEPSKTNSVAIEASELLVVPFEDLESLHQQMPIVAQFSQIIGNQKTILLNDRNESLLVNTPEERYYKLIERQPELHNRVPQYLIAQYLGIRPESLSRIRKRYNS